MTRSRNLLGRSTAAFLAVAILLFVSGCTDNRVVADDRAEDAGHRDQEKEQDQNEGKQAGKGGKHDEEDGHGEQGHGEAAELSIDKLERAGVTFSTVGPGHVDNGVQLLGTVRPNGNQLAHITPRFPGIVRESKKNVGDTVRAGDLLAIVESSESLSTYELRTLIDGTIIERHLTRGEAIDRERQAFVVADLSTVWVELSVYQRDLDRVRVGQTVRVRIGTDGPQAEGTIDYITPGVDESMRTATARVVLPNPEGWWRLGSFVEAYAVSPDPAPLVVPNTALQTLEGKSVVFVAEKDHVEPRAVTLGHRGETLVEVVSGLTAGERVATANSFLLKAELGKGKAEHED